MVTAVGAGGNGMAGGTLVAAALGTRMVPAVGAGGNGMAGGTLVAAALGKRMNSGMSSSLSLLAYRLFAGRVWTTAWLHLCFAFLQFTQTKPVLFLSQRAFLLAHRSHGKGKKSPLGLVGRANGVFAGGLELAGSGTLDCTGLFPVALDDFFFACLPFPLPTPLSVSLVLPPI